MKIPKVGLDNYCLFPKNLMPDEVVKWASENGAEGVAFSGFPEESREKFNIPYLHEVSKMAKDFNLYLEWGNGQHVPRDLSTFSKKEILSSNRKAVEQANALGARIIRSCSGGLMRWNPDAPDTEVFLKEAAVELKKQSSMFRDNGTVLAIETHFEFTTFELIRLLEMCETDPGDWLGICLDTMNLLTMLEDPVAATRRILPWIVSTHLKDGGLLTDNEGIITFPSPLGKGIIDLGSIINLLKSLNKEIHLSVESHGGSFFLPVKEEWFMSRFPDLMADEFNHLMILAEKTSHKVKSEDLRITERADWPLICEERTRNDIKNLKIIRDKLN
jgi:sugar phosphate isomerase/epimerase